MNCKIVDLKGKDVAVPVCYQQVDCTPECPEESVPLMAQSEDSACYVLLQEIEPADALPFDDDSRIIGIIHNCLSDEQGLIEVGSGGNPGSRYVYTIMKTLENPDIPDGVQYKLTLDKEYEKDVIRVQGFFDEQGTSGMRDAMIFQILASEDGFDETKATWTQDPYDPSYDQGLLMNRSELRDYDEMFPSHPLSMARRLVDVVCR